MSEVIVVTSGKGGVGKTTTSANVGTGLAMLGEKVILIDTDIGLRNLDGDGTGEPHRLQPCGRRGGKLPSEAGTDKRQKISKPVFTSVRPDQGQVFRDSRPDAKAGG